MSTNELFSLDQYSAPLPTRKKKKYSAYSVDPAWDDGSAFPETTSKVGLYVPGSDALSADDKFLEENATSANDKFLEENSTSQTQLEAQTQIIAASDADDKFLEENATSANDKFLEENSTSKVGLYVSGSDASSTCNQILEESANASSACNQILEESADELSACNQILEESADGSSACNQILEESADSNCTTFGSCQRGRIGACQKVERRSTE